MRRRHRPLPRRQPFRRQLRRTRPSPSGGPEFVTRRDDLNKELAKIYTARFTEDELNQMVAFYKTPAGQKFSTMQAEVLQASVPVVQAWSRKLSTDMAQRIKEEVAKKGQKL